MVSPRVMKFGIGIALFVIIFLISYTVLGLFGFITININYLQIIAIGAFAYIIYITLSKTDLKRWL